MMKIALIGADGQLGSDLVKSLKDEDIIPLFYPEFDLTNSLETRRALSDISPDVIINTAAYHKVDECEENPQLVWKRHRHSEDLAHPPRCKDCLSFHQRHSPY